MTELESLIESIDKDFSAEDMHFRCISHIINLSAQNLLVQRKLESDADLKDYNEIDDEECESELKIPEQEKKNATPLSKLRTLFLKSAFDMIAKGKKLEKALILLCNTDSDLRPLQLKEFDWCLLKTVVKYLRYFKALSTTLCGEKYVTFPLVIFGFNLSIDKLEKLITCLNFKTLLTICIQQTKKIVRITHLIRYILSHTFFESWKKEYIVNCLTVWIKSQFLEQINHSGKPAFLCSQKVPIILTMCEYSAVRQHRNVLQLFFSIKSVQKCSVIFFFMNSLDSNILSMKRTYFNISFSRKYHFNTDFALFLNLTN